MSPELKRKIKQSIEALRYSLTNWMEIADDHDHRQYDVDAVRGADVVLKLLDDVDIDVRKDIQCRGRNGWFAFDRINVVVSEERAWVEVYSKRWPTSKSGPIMFAPRTRAAKERLADELQEVVYRLKGGK